METQDLITDAALGARVRQLRLDLGVTLDGLAERSGVSRAMISRIERGEANPTAQLLARLCHGLGTTLSRFFAGTQAPGAPLRRHADQHVWQDPETGYRRRAVSPEGVGSPVDLVDVVFPPGGRVVFERNPFEAAYSQHLWLLEGRMRMTAGDATHDLEAGDCLFMRLDEAIVFSNPHPAPARYAIILHKAAS